MPFTPQSPLIIWRIVDGRPGHEKQTRGLANALARLVPTQALDIVAAAPGKAFGNWILGRFPEGAGLESPDLILAAGHRTHFPALAARRAYGGKIILLMRPSLPYGWFDLCLVPDHDRPPLRSNVVPTRGAINAVVRGATHDSTRGLIMIGGPSEHFSWDTDELIRQVRELVSREQDVQWTLTTSRRTPGEFLALLGSVPAHCHPAEETAPGWLEARLAECAQAWVTPDSVSMVYEALTSGCRVGLFHLRPNPESRVARAMRALARDGLVLTVENAGHMPEMPGVGFDEATRCAGIVLERWFK